MYSLCWENHFGDYVGKQTVAICALRWKNHFGDYVGKQTMAICALILAQLSENPSRIRQSWGQAMWVTLMIHAELE